MAKKSWNIRSIFFEDDPGGKTPAKSSSVKQPEKQSPAPSKPASAPAAAPSSAPTGRVSSASEPVTGGVSERFVKVLMAAMESANLPGFDYLEYKKSLQNLKKMNFTDDVRFQTAYTAAQSMGVTPGQLAESAQHYLDTLAKEQAKFSQALAGQQAQQVGNKREQVKQLAGSVARQEAKIKELQAEIAKTKAKQQKLQEDIENSTSKLRQTKADFEMTYQVLTEGIRKDVQSMKEYLK